MAKPVNNNVITIDKFDGIVNKFTNNKIPPSSFHTLRGVKLTPDGRLAGEYDLDDQGVSLGGDIIDAVYFKGKYYFLVSGKYIKKWDGLTLDTIYTFANTSTVGKLEVFADSTLYATNGVNDVVSFDGQSEVIFKYTSISGTDNSIESSCLVGNIMYVGLGSGRLSQFNITTGAKAILPVANASYAINTVSTNGTSVFCGMSGNKEFYEWVIGASSMTPREDASFTPSTIYCSCYIAGFVFLGCSDGHIWKYSVAGLTYTDCGLLATGETKVVSMKYDGSTYIWCGTGDTGHLVRFKVSDSTKVDKGIISGGDTQILTVELFNSLLYLGMNGSGIMISFDPATDAKVNLGIVDSGNSKVNSIVGLKSALYNYLIIGVGSTQARVVVYNIGDANYTILNSPSGETNIKSLLSYSLSKVVGGTSINSNILSVDCGSLYYGGTNNFSDSTVVSIGDTLTSTNYCPLIMPTAAPGGTLGDVVVTARTTSTFTVIRTGSATGTFDWILGV